MEHANHQHVPTLSVLMTVFNGRKYVREAIESVLSQTYRDFEFILIDDGSTDESHYIAWEYATQDRRIRLISRPNKGLTKSLNEGLISVRGKYVARMDADDVCLPQRFEKQVKFLNANDDHVLVGCRCMLVDPDGFPICEKRDIVFTHEEIDSGLMRMSWPVVHPAVIMRTDALRKVGGYNERYRTNQDHDLFLRLAEVGKLANLDEVLLLYRQHFESVGFTKVELQTNTVLEIAKAAHARRGVPIPGNFKAGPASVLHPREHHRNWTWWALAAHNIPTARRHAFALLRNSPLSAQSWRAMYCAVRGH